VELFVNGEPVGVAPDATVADVVAQLRRDPAARGVAVALNGEVVPRAEWPTRAVREGDRIEVLTAVGGG
jgi:sulfur carrier protein